MATLEDVAAVAGVAITTVSRALRNDATLKITADTRERILAAAQKVGYEQKRQKSGPVKRNILIVHKDTHFDNQMDNAYYFSMRTGQEAACMERGVDYKYIPYSLLEPMGEPCDGAVIMGNFRLEELDFILKTLQTNHLVFTGLMNFYPEKMDWVTYDVSGALELLVRYLVQRGKRTVVYFGGTETPGSSPRYSKSAAFKAHAQALGLRCLDCADVDHGTENGYKVMREWLKKGRTLPDAFVASNDPIAIGMMKALAEAGIRIPEEVSIMAVNGDSSGEFMNPPLTTVDVHTKWMGMETVLTLLEQIESGRNYRKKIEFSPALLERASVGGETEKE